MELKDRKYIKNTGKLPGFANGLTGENISFDSYGNVYESKGYASMPTGEQIKTPGNTASGATSRWENFDVGGAIGGITNLTGSIVKAHSFDTTSNDLINKYGGSDQHIDDVYYHSYNDINKSAERNLVSKQNTQNTLSATGTGAATGAAIGSMIAPGLGTLIGGAGGALVGLVGGLFGGSRRKHENERAMREAQQKVDNMNAMARSDAYTTYLQREQAKKYGDTSSQSLFSYKCGKSPKYANGKQVYSAFGPVNAKPDSRVSKGEVAIDTSTGSMYRIPTGPNDTALFAGGKDPNIAIITNKYGLSDYAMIDPEGAIEMQTMLKNTGKLGKNELGYKCGKLPKHENGIAPWGNIMSAGATGLAGLYQYLQASSDKPYQPNTYVANPYMKTGLNTLAGLRISPYPIIQQMRAAEARTNYATNASGGLSTAQKNLARISALNGTQQNIANLLTTVQNQNNTYRTQYANAALQYGDKTASDRMTAMRHDIDYYGRSHAARQQGMQMGIYNMIDALNSYYANDFKRRTHNENMDLYREKNKIDWEKVKMGLS